MVKTKVACVLVVDDHVDTVNMIDRLLTNEGYSVLTATTTAQAFGLLRAIKCELIISDIGLPDGSGLELLREASARYGIIGIAISGHMSDAYREAAEAAGVHRFLEKPVDFKSLIAHVRELSARA